MNSQYCSDKCRVLVYKTIHHLLVGSTRMHLDYRDQDAMLMEPFENFIDVLSIRYGQSYTNLFIQAGLLCIVYR